MKISREKSFMVDPFLFLYIVTILLTIAHVSGDSNTTTEIPKEFTAVPGQLNTRFEPLLTDSNGIFAFGFLPIGPTKLDLAIIHLPSSQPIWRAGPSILPNWASTTTFSFDGNLVLTDTSIQKQPLWSSNSEGGDFVDLQRTSNLQINKFAGEDTPVWQSFDHPFDTLVQGQNLTSLASLTTSDKQYAFRIRSPYIALYMILSGDQEVNYWRHAALKAASERDIYAQVNATGFLGIYNLTDGYRLDVIPFDSFQRGVVGFHRLTIQSDGNLYAYYWDNKTWNLVYVAVTEPCGLPGKCGSYGLCVPGKSVCSCLVNGTDGCLQTDSGDFCGTNSNDFTVVRKSGVTVEYTDIMVTEHVSSLADCENICQSNCSCWGALFVSTTNNCYMMDYPIQTLEAAGDTHQGYFKVRPHGAAGGAKNGHKTVIAIVVIFTLIFAALAAYGGYWFWERKRNRLPRVNLGGQPSQEMTPGPYRDLKTMPT
ncbi:hypothetical protein LUZ60_008783 [Juncus effusus]|nr:hypothetical protein LUZ60_008783 [Juncus effusus]